MQGAALCNALYLRDDDAARVTGRHGNSQSFQGQGLPLHAEVAIRVRRGGADDADRNGEGLVEQILLAVDLHQAHQVFRGAGVDLAATPARVYEGVNADMGERAGLARRDITKQVGDDALGQVVGFNGIGNRQLLQGGHQAPVAAHYPLDHAGMAQVVEPAARTIALAGGVDQGQVARGTSAGLGLRFQKALL